jgi:hypothetical protein
MYCIARVLLKVATFELYSQTPAFIPVRVMLGAAHSSESVFPSDKRNE